MSSSAAIGTLRRRILHIGVSLAVGNLIAWAGALVLFRHHPLLMGAAVLAYGFGLRHAVDADHIAAIDNLTRKLMQEGKQPLTVGLYFSLGHSTVVVALTLLVAIAASVLKAHIGHWTVVGGVIGTAVSALFLFAIAAVNLVILAATWRTLRDTRRGRQPPDAPELPGGGGLMTRLFRGIFRLIEHPWQVYGLGLLFGLGFDTASQVGLLGLSAMSASKGLSPWTILVLPALFSAGMALVDTADSVLMVGAYGWAFVKPIRRLYYNLTLTTLSVLVALLIGGIETLGLIARDVEPPGGFWRGVAALNADFGLLGYGIIGLFALGWLVALLVYKMKRYETT